MKHQATARCSTFSLLWRGVNSGTLSICLAAGGLMAAGTSYGQPLSTFDAPDSTQTLITGINQDGSFVGYYTGTNHLQHGFLVAEGAFTTIDAPPASGPPPFAITQALAINSRGDILVLSGNFATGDQQYYVLSDGTYNPFQIAGAQFIEATGINTRGDIVGTYSDASGKQRGFLLSGGNLTNIDVPGAQYTFAHGINGQGDIVGWYAASGSTQVQGFLLSGGVYTTLDGGTSWTELEAIAGNGQIAGSCFPSSCTVMNGTFSTIPIPNSRASGATGLTNDGEVVGWYNDTNGHQHGYILAAAGDN